MGSDERHDVVVIGGGPAGVSCALECFDIQLDAVLVEAGSELGGQLAAIPHSVRNVAAGRFEDGVALARALQASAAILGDRVRLSGAVTGAHLADRSIDVAGRRFSAQALVIATGSATRQVAAAVDGALDGDVTYQLESHRERFVGRDVAVIGGHDSATLDALELARTSPSVKLVHRSDALTARQDIVRQVRAESRIEDLSGWELDAVHGTDGLEEIVLVRPATGERRTIAVQGLIVKVGRQARTELFRGELELDRAGAIVVDGDLRTSREGVFAVGDVVSGAYPRVATAFGQGALAARSVLRFLEGRS